MATNGKCKTGKTTTTGKSRTAANTSTKNAKGKKEKTDLLKGRKTTINKRQAVHTNFIEVYKRKPTKTKNGITNIATATGKSGVYLIKEDNKLVYIGFATKNIYKTAIGHFQKWNSDQYVVSYAGKRKKYTIQFYFCTAKDAYFLEKYLITKNKPRDNASMPIIKNLTLAEQVKVWESEELAKNAPNYSIKELEELANEDLPF